MNVNANVVPASSAGALTISGPISLTGTLNVAAGKVFATTLPGEYATPAYGTLQLGAGTTYRDTVASTFANQVVAGVIVPVTGGTAGFSIGQTVTGLGIPAGATIVDLSDSSLTLSIATTMAVNPTTTGNQNLVAVEETFGDFFTGDIVGPSTSIFEKAGLGNLILGTQLSFEGAVDVLAGTLTLGVNGVLDSARSIHLGANTTLQATGLALDLNDLSGDSTSTIDAPGSTLAVNVAAGSLLTYSGRVIGAPTLDFYGAPATLTAAQGTLRLDRPATSPNVIGDINVYSGKLIGTIAGFGGAALFVDAGATIGFDNPDATTPLNYSGTVSGTGTILKTGLGQITLANATAASDYVVEQGKLVVRDGGSAAPSLFVTAQIASGATLEVVLGANFSRDLGTQVAGTSPTSQGTLAISNSTTSTSNVFLTAAPALASISLGDYVRLNQNSQSTISGVNGTALAELNFDTGGAVTINQALNTSFIGTVTVPFSTQLTIVGAGRAGFTNPLFDNQLGANATLTVGTAVAVGNLEVDSHFGSSTPITLVKGSLAVNTAGGTLAAPETFSTALAGAANAVKFVKTGAGVLSASTGSTAASAVFSSYEVEAGTLVVTPYLNQILGGRSVSLNGGNLAIQQDSANAVMGTAGFTTASASGTISVLGNGGSTGTLTITGSFAGGLDLTNGANVVLGTTGNAPIAITGTLNVDATSTLGGQVVVGTGAANADLVNRGNVAPGYSPGIVTVNGNVQNSGTFTMELSAASSNGTYNDQVQFTGVADLNQAGTGKITLKQFGSAAPAFGQRFVLFKDTVGASPTSFTTVIPETSVTSQGISPFRYLMAYPADSVGGVAGEIAVYVVRAPSDYDAFKAPASLLTSVKAITQVDSVLQNNGLDGLVGTADDVYRSIKAGSFTNVGAGLAILGDVQLQAALDNLTPYGAAGTVTAAGALFRQVSDSAARRLELRRFDRSSLTILSNEWYVDTVGGQFNVEGQTGLNNKATTYGITAGFSTQARLDGVAGFSLTAQRFSLSSDVATQASGNGVALSGYVGTVAARGQLSLDAGATLSYLSSSVTRDSVVAGANEASAHALTLGAWARVGTVFSAKSSNTYFTPFMGVDFAVTDLGDLNETGSADAMNVKAGSVSSSNLRVGFGVHHMWEEGRGDWRYRLSADIGYSKELSGEFGDFASSNPAGVFNSYSSSLRVNAGSGFYVNPSLNFGPDENSTFTVGLTYQQGNGKSVGLNAGYRKRF